MKNRVKHIGLIMGAVMMFTVAGAGSAFAGNQTTGTAAAPVSAESKDQGSKTTQQAKSTEKNNSLFYGKVKKVKKNTLVLNSASVVWEMTDENRQKTSSENEKKEAESKTAGTEKAATNADIAGDLETATMKWKLDGKKISVKTDKDTKYVMEVSAADNKTVKKDEKGSSSESSSNIQNKVIKLEDIKKGMLLKVTLKADNSMTAQEIMVVADVREKEPVGGADTDKTAQKGTTEKSEKDTTGKQS